MGNKLSTIFISLVILFVLSSNKTDKHYMSDNKTYKGHLFIEEPRQSFGHVYRDVVNEVCCSYKLKNTGKKPIVINKIEASCGCMHTDLTSKVIFPGKEQILTIKLNTKSQYGYINKSVFINSDSDNPLFIVRIQGDIE